VQNKSKAANSVAVSVCGVRCIAKYWNKIVFFSLSIFALLLAHAHAQDYPNRRITLVAPYAAGGGFDGVARLLADALGRTLGQTVIVENIEGAGGVIGTRQVARAAPDGYTLLLNHMGMATAPLTVKNLQFDPLTSFSFVGLFVQSPALLIGRRDLPANTVAELAQYVKANPNGVTIASSGVGSGTDLCATLFEQAIGAKITHIQYRGAGPAMIDVEASRVDLLCETPFGLLPEVLSGAAKPFLISGDHRIASMPNVPTANEAALKKFNLATTWYGLYAPRDTSGPIIDRLTVALQSALKDPDVLKRTKQLDMSPFAESQATPAELQKYLSSEISLLGEAFREAGISPH
jgi:tripartite-type tricarboxylate transporter receptor subunit TctC